jgi:GST-like protein
MFLEETGIAYKVHPVNIQKDEQFKPEFLKISPNNKIPAIVDRDPEEGDKPISVFESGAILLYLAEKNGKLISTDLRERMQTLQWLFWQVGGFGPMLGQQSFFRRHKEPIPFAIERYTNETKRLFGVLNKRLEESEFLAGKHYSIADIATYPWAAPYEMLHQNLDDFPHIERWLDNIAARPATQRAYALAKNINPDAAMPPAPRKQKAA